MHNKKGHLHFIEKLATILFHFCKYLFVDRILP